MSIRVRCPDCQAQLNAPDAAAGKRVKCPKCELPVSVPAVWADDHDDAEPAPLAPLPPSKRPKVKRPRVEDDDEYDARPTRARGAGLAGSLPMFGFVVLALGGLAAVGGALWLIAGALDGVKKKPEEKAVAPPEPAPAAAPGVTWTPFVAPDGSFAAAFPNGPPVPGSPDQVAQMAGPLKQLLGSSGITSAGWFRADGNRRYAVTWLALPPAVAGKLNLGQLFAQGAAVQMGGYPAQQSLTARPDGGRTLSRTAVVKNRVLTVAVDGDHTLTADDPTAVAFLTKFEVRNVPDPPAAGADPFAGLQDLLKELDPDANPKKKP